MSLSNLRIGFAMTGSFCTYEKVFAQMKGLVEAGANVTPIFSFHAQTINSRFGKAEDFLAKAKEFTGNNPVLTIDGAEPLGPKNLLDIMLIAPCTGNTMSKLCIGITDTPVLMGVKGHLRNNKPVIIALATNDGLSMNLKNIGSLMNTKNIFFVPFGQDDANKKPNSLIAHMNLIPDTIEQALLAKQLQPVLKEYPIIAQN